MIGGIILILTMYGCYYTLNEIVIKENAERYFRNEYQNIIRLTERRNNIIKTDNKNIKQKNK